MTLFCRNDAGITVFYKTLFSKTIRDPVIPPGRDITWTACCLQHREIDLFSVSSSKRVKKLCEIRSHSPSLGRTATVVRDGSDISDADDLEAVGIQRTDGSFSA